MTHIKTHFRYHACITPTIIYQLLSAKKTSLMKMWFYIVSINVIWLHNRSQSLSLTHWGRVTHICVNKLTIIGSDNGLSPGRRQAIIWTNDGILLIAPLGTNFSEILIEIYIFSFKKMHLKMSSGNWQPFCFGLNVLKDACGECPSW